MSANERLARLETQLDAMDKKLDRVLLDLEGPTGMVVRLDRLEQAHQRVKQWTKAAVAAAFAALASKVIPYLPMKF